MPYPIINNGESGSSVRTNKLNPILNSIREVLTSNRIYYVATTGSDTTGIGSVSAPWATLQYAYDVIVKTLDTAGFLTTVQVSAGTYAAGLNITMSWTGGGIIQYVGDITTPSNVFINSTGSCFEANNMVLPAALKIGGFKLSSSGGLLVNNNAVGTIWINGAMEFGSASVYQISAGLPGANIYIDFIDYTISGGAQAHIYAAFFGLLYSDANNITLTGTPNFSVAFAFCEAQGQMEVLGATFIGNATGVKFISNTLSAIFANSDFNYFPGNAKGSITSEGLYNLFSKVSATAFTVATLPDPAIISTGFVIDSDATLAAGLGNIVVHTSGSNYVPVYSDGTNWRIG